MGSDTIVAAMRSPNGASAALLQAVRVNRLPLLATVPLCIEYESVCSRPEHIAAAGFSPANLTVFLDAVIGMAEPIQAWFLWRPQLRDPGDEMVLEAAVNGRANAIATFNRRDFVSGSARFGIEVLLPAQAISRMIQ